MIIVKTSEDKSNGSMTLSLTGHAGAAEKGRDIICASATMLAYTLAQTAKQLYEKGRLKRKPNIRLEEGDILITVRPKGSAYEEAKLIYGTIMNGYELLVYNYPQYLEIIKKGDTHG